MKISNGIFRNLNNNTNNLGRYTDKDEKQSINNGIKSKKDSVVISSSLKKMHNVRIANSLLQEEYSNYNYKDYRENNLQNKKKEKEGDKEKVYIIVNGELIELPALEKDKEPDEKDKNKTTHKVKHRILNLFQEIIEEEQQDNDVNNKDVNNKNQKDEHVTEGEEKND